MSMQRISCVLLCALLASCASGPTEKAIDPFQVTEFKAPLETPLSVETGGAMFVSGTYIKSEKVTLTADLSTFLPGALGIPFPVNIKAGDLPLTSVTAQWKYFCAQEGHATASFPGLGSVVSQDDCIGIRQSLLDGHYEWVVDNSNYNRMTSIWSRNIDPDYPHMKKSVVDQPFRIRSLTRIVFDGASGGTYKFTLEEITSTQKSEKTFSFDRTPDGGTTIGIKGKVFRVLNADNVKMTYVWVKL